MCTRTFATRLVISAFAAIGASVVSQGAVSSPIPIDDLARLPQISSISMSRDGSYIVALVSSGPNAELPSLSVWNLDDSDAPPVIAYAGGDAEFIDARALKGGKIVSYARSPYTGKTYGCIESTTGTTRTYQYKLFVSDRDLKKFDDPFAISGILRGRGEETRRCLELANRGQIRGDLLPLDPENIVIAELNIKSFRTDYRKVNVRTGQASLLFTDENNNQASYIDPRDGTVWTRSRVEFRNGAYNFETYVREAKTGDYARHDALTWTSSDRHQVDIVGRDEATGKYYVATDKFSDKASIYFYDSKTKQFESEPVFATEQYAARGVVLGETEQDFNNLLGFTYEGPTIGVYWVNEELHAIQAQLDRIFSGLAVKILDFTGDRSKVLFSTSSINQPDQYFLLRDKSEITAIGGAYPWLDGKEMAAGRLVHYRARDGLEVPAILTLPAGWKPSDKPGPAVVIPHGGPWARDYAEWDGAGWVQYFASRGYAVLQPQYRGSTGWGRELWLKGDAQWGKKMQDDKDDGAYWLAAQGYADPERIIIMGYSYGGYAAFAASVRENSPFQCAIAGAGVSDLPRIGATWSEDRVQRFLQGVTVDGLNPISSAQSITMPILIFHGDRDVRVSLFHSTSFYNRARSMVPATFVKIDDMPHSFPWRPSWKRQTLEAIDDFLAGDCKI